MRLECLHCGRALDLRVARGRDEERDGELLERVVQIIREHDGPISGRGIRITVKRRRADVREALIEARDAGQIREIGPGKGWVIA